MLTGTLFFVAMQTVVATSTPTPQNVAAIPQATSPTITMSEPNPKAMTRAEINAHNAQLARNHPFYIRCVKSADTGSLIKRKSSCRTNQQWAAAEEAGNREARDIADRMSSKATNTN